MKRIPIDCKEGDMVLIDHNTNDIIEIKRDNTTIWSNIDKLYEKTKGTCYHCGHSLYTVKVGVCPDKIGDEQKYINVCFCVNRSCNALGLLQVPAQRM